MALDAAFDTLSKTRKNSNNVEEANKSSVKVYSDQQRETAQYVADMVLELRNMAKSVRLFNVTVPLEYAYYEAFSVANRVEVPPEDVKRIRELERQAQENAA